MRRESTAASSASEGGETRIELRGALAKAMARLRAARVRAHALSAELLLMHALGRDRTWIYTHTETTLEPEAAERYFALVARRAAGEPTQYLTGKQEFWGLEFEVTPAVLIPRPETEHVIEAVLERLDGRSALRLADIGTGSGCLAVALARELPRAEVVATDLSEAAVAIAARNALRHQVAERVRLVCGNLLDPFGPHARFDAIVSNPPYVARDQARTLRREVREHEPDAALFGGRTGTECYGPLIEQAGSLLRERGLLVLELGYNGLGRVLQIVRGQLGWGKVSVRNDLAGIPRVLAAERLG